MESFLPLIGGKRIAAYGAGRVLRSACEILGSGFVGRMECILDKKAEVHFAWGGHRIPVKKPSDFAAVGKDGIVLLITPLAYPEIFDELNGCAAFDGVECYIYPVMRDTATPHDFPAPVPGAAMRIPKRINHVWFGGGKMSDVNKRCLESWHRYCPDYEIVLFNEDAYDVTKQPFMHAAHKARKWASAAEYARLDILREHGGIYLDADVELIRNPDFLLYNDFFGYLQSDWFAVNFFGCVPGFPLIEKLMKPYIDNDYSQIQSAVEYSEKIIVDSYKTNVMLANGFRLWRDGEPLNGGANIFPQDMIVLNTRSGQTTPNTVGIHYYERTWCEELIPREKRFGDFFAAHADELGAGGV